MFTYLFIICACIEVKLECKILIIAIMESIKIISNHTAMLFCISNCVANNGNIEYIY